MPRFIFSILLLLLALLTVIPAPVYILWYVAILVEELPWVFIGITIIMLFFGFRFNYLQLISTVILICALVLFLHPVAAAYKKAWKIDKEMTAAFGPVEKSAVRRKPFSLFRMFSPAGKEEPYKRMTYDTAHQLTLDYYPATGTGPMPCVVVIHGGSWRNGDSRQLPELNSILAKAGYNVAAINYRKVPECTSPAPVEDLHTALTFLHKNAASLHLDTSRLVLLGRSAGAQIDRKSVV